MCSGLDVLRESRAREAAERVSRSTTGQHRAPRPQGSNRRQRVAGSVLEERVRRAFILDVEYRDEVQEGRGARAPETISSSAHRSGSG